MSKSLHGKHNLTFKVTLKILLAMDAAVIGGFYASYANFQGNIRWAPGAKLVMTEKRVDYFSFSKRVILTVKQKTGAGRRRASVGFRKFSPSSGLPAWLGPQKVSVISFSY